jgi:excinuclease ABC subunit C
LLDGGAGHVNAVSKVLEQLDVHIPLFGMVKDDKHRTRGLVVGDNVIDITKDLTVLRFVTAIQDEAHRFAIEYNKKLRTKRYARSVLDDIEGVGQKRKKALLKHFGSVNNIKKAGVGDLLAVEGINRPAAEKIYEFFHS